MAMEALSALREQAAIWRHVDYHFAGFSGAQGEVEVIAVVAVVAPHFEAPVPGAQPLRPPAVVAFAVEDQL
jgi:hypothetical protein